MDEMTLDEYEQSGTGTGAVLKLGGMPVLGSPWFTFPLSAERKSGFLSPVLGMSSARGLDISVPYYFNIAPNYDYTLTPQIITKRGVMIGNEFRFLNKHLEGEITGEYMPHDNDYGDKRYSLPPTFAAAGITSGTASTTTECPTTSSSTTFQRVCATTLTTSCRRTTGSITRRPTGTQLFAHEEPNHQRHGQALRARAAVLLERVCGRRRRL